MSQHQAKFTWGAGPNSVNIAGSFNDWSADATPLHKQPDGTFSGEVPVPYGEKQAFKYVVDGEWKVREDEAKEWDAAGNMNNVYTPPHPPAPAAAAASSTSAPSDQSNLAATSEKNEDKGDVKSAAVPAAAAGAAVPVAAAAAAVPAATTADKAAPVKSEPTQPENLMASSAPSAASTGPALGAPIAKSDPSAVPATQTTTTTTSTAEPVAGTAAAVSADKTPATSTSGATAAPVAATAAVPVEKAPTTTDSTPVQISKTAANANVGEAPVEEQHTLQERAAEYGAGAIAAVGGVLGGAFLAVEKATGIDLTHGNPLTVEEAQAKGIDVNTLQQTELGTDATSPVGTKPPASAVAALEEKTQALKLSNGATGATGAAAATGAKEQASVPLPNGEAPKSSYANAPEPIGQKAGEPIKHDIPAQNETSENHKTVPAPVITAVADKDPKKDRSLDAPTNSDTAGTKPVSTDPAVSAKDAKKEAETSPAATGSTPGVAQGTTTPAPSSGLAAGEATARPDAPSKNTNVDSPAPPSKDVSSPAAPTTPSKSTPTAGGAAGISSLNSTPASTPAKSQHKKEETSGSDVRKRKSSFFHKIKTAFSPKDKEKK